MSGHKSPAADTPGTLPLSRPVPILELPGKGLEVTVTPSEAERAAVARSLGLVSIESLTGTFHLTRNGRVVHVTGEVAADFHQTCVVTLDAFPSAMRETVDVRYSEDVKPPEHPEMELTEAALDAPEPLVGGRLDVGALTVEFLALGLDPYPRKPGAEFAYHVQTEEDPSPFAGLAQLKGKPE
jgi:hypothetical protein